jgi:hypothetical protein
VKIIPRQGLCLLRDPEVRNVFLKRSFEPDYIKLASAILSEGGVSFECGANFGLSTFGLIPSFDLDHLPFHLFEANPNLIRYLEKSKSLFPSAAIQVVEGCISDHGGTFRSNSRNARDILVSSYQADGTSGQEKPGACRGQGKAYRRVGAETGRGRNGSAGRRWGGSA